MNEEPVKAWQPFTFGGVARYGQDWVGRLFFSSLVVSILTGAVALWTASRAWFPVIEEAIGHLPAGAEIRDSKLTAPQSLRLAENPFLSFRLDPAGEGEPASSGDVQIVLAPAELRFRTLFGVTAIPYRPEWTVPLSPAEWEPKWAAWRPAVMAYLFFGTIAALFASWMALAIVYALPVRLLALSLKRSLSLWGAWKLSAAALLPAAILLTVAVGLYGLGQIRLIELAFTWALHFVVGWVFAIGAAFRLPRLKKMRANPFGHMDSESESDEEQAEKKARNPFKARGKRNRGGPPSS